VLAWGLLFLLTPVAQARAIEKVAGALNPGGRFLFTAPKEPLEWLDAMTGRPSHSLGAQTYERLLRDAGLTWVAEAQDEGENHYYFVERRPSRGLEGQQHERIDNARIRSHCDRTSASPKTFLGTGKYREKS
jgi:hypothetical protein